MSKAQNDSVIKRAFEKFKSREYRIIEEGMIRLARMGLEYLIEEHNNFDMFEHHVLEENTLGWAVAYDGKLITSGCHHGSDTDLPGDARAVAEAVATAHSEGWVAIILSDMKGYYNESREMDFLIDTEFNIASEFSNYFKPFYYNPNS